MDYKKFSGQWLFQTINLLKAIELKITYGRNEKQCELSMDFRR